MLPTTVTPVAALPLTADAKLDAERLPAPAAPRSPARDTVPVTGDADLTERLREIWSEVLGVPVRLDDDSFELAATPRSPSAQARPCARWACRRCGKELYLYRRPTIRKPRLDRTIYSMD
ncbi:hypothetical protein ACFYO0_40585 [Streptomyces sp. NPDC006365]|uniref:hypothetical protein n=1 Tax=Streptomyces sp. NPDC006365 TaxID=3364744 RepID=UPI0036B129B3